MNPDSSRILAQAKLMRPVDVRSKATWTFLILPREASARLRSRGMVTVEGTLHGVPFKATLEPDGQRSHWLRVDGKLSKAAGVVAGDLVTVEFAPVQQEPEPTVPADLQKALDGAAKARVVWLDITPVARRDWIQWIASAKQESTRMRRIQNACSMLASGKRRVCCFDRSGIFSKGLKAPRGSESKVESRKSGKP